VLASHQRADFPLHPVNRVADIRLSEFR
jgi:hypothetical protein